MSRMRDLVIDIQDAIEQGGESFVEIAERFNVTFADVKAISDALDDYYDMLARSHTAVDVGCEFDPKY